MKAYLLSAVIGVLVGMIYGFFNVRSPAPPVIALVGLLAMLAGEQLPPLMKRLWRPMPTQTSWIEQQIKPHMFGELPRCAEAEKAVAAWDDQENAHG